MSREAIRKASAVVSSLWRHRHGRVLTGVLGFLMSIWLAGHAGALLVGTEPAWLGRLTPFRSTERLTGRCLLRDCALPSATMSKITLASLLTG